MTDLRRAAEIALDCLDYHWDNPDSELEQWPYVVKAKQALRKALAQPNKEWVGLTDEDMEDLFLSEDGVCFARYIEVKLKEKNSG